MSYTNSTTHFNWPLPVETDLFNGLDDNQMKEELDEKIYSLEQTSQDDHAAVVQLSSDVQRLGQTVEGYDQTIEEMQGTLTEHAERLILLTNRQTELSRQLGTKASEATIAEAYNEESGYHIGEFVYHSNILYEANVAIQAPAGDFDSSKWDIVTLADKVEGNTSASGITYDNIGSGMAATDVQEAIDELKSDSDKSIDNNVIATLTSGVDTTMQQDGVLVADYATSGTQYGGLTIVVNSVKVGAIGQLQTTNPPLSGTLSYPVKKGDIVNVEYNATYGTTGSAKVYALS